MKTKVCWLLLIVFSTVVFSGCWSRFEVETLAIVGGIGIDKVKEQGKDKFLLTVNVIRPGLGSGGSQGGGSKGEPIFWQVAVTGDTLMEAAKNLSMRVTRKVFFGQDRYVVIGEKAAKEDLASIIDFLQRNEEARLRMLIMVTPGLANEALLTTPDLENTLAREIENVNSVTARDISRTRITDLVRVTDALITPGEDPVLAKVEVAQSPPTVPGKPPPKVIRFVGGGAIKEKNLVGWLSPKELRGWLLVTGLASRGIYSFKFKNVQTAVTLVNPSSKIKTTVSGQKVTTNIEISVEGDLAEYGGQQPIATNAGIRDLEKAYGKAIESEVRMALKKAQSLDSDIFGFGADIYRHDPKGWKKLEKDWYKIFSKMKINLKVKADIRRTGFTANPFILR